MDTFGIQEEREDYMVYLHFTKIMRQLIFIFILAIGVNSFAQNLVPNGGFENYTELPTDQSQIHLAKGWFAAKSNSRNTPDYFHTDSPFPEKYTVSVKYYRDVIQNESSHSGNAFVGFFARRGSEILGCKLISPLQAEQKYIVRFYVRLGLRSRYAVDNIGCAILSKAIFFRDNSGDRRGYNFQPQVVSPTKKPIIEKERWTKVEGVFKAKGGEQFLYIGRFASDKDSRIKKLKKTKNQGVWAFYYVDDVSLFELDSDGNRVVAQVKDTTSIISEQDLIPKENDDIISQLGQTEIGEALILNNILFEFDKSELLPESFIQLQELTGYLKRNISVEIEVSGHTDNIGNTMHNIQLSSDRSKAVVDYLVSQGINKNRLTFKGFGSKKAIADNNIELGRKTNRRVEIKVVSK